MDCSPARLPRVGAHAGPSYGGAQVQAAAGATRDGCEVTAATGDARVAAVIVTYNSADVLLGCLQSLARQRTLVDVVVADNASTDQSCAIAQTFDDLPVRVVEMGRNAGYAAGINAGIGQLDLDSLDAVLVLNPDCRAGPGALPTLAAALQNNPSCGVVVPSLMLPSGTRQFNLYRTPTVIRALVEGLLPSGIAGRLGPLGERVADPRVYEHPGATVWATGAAMLLSVSALCEVGPWDESFLLFSEETEYCLRAADKGWRTWYEPAAVFEHSGGGTGGDDELNPTLAALLTVNRVELFRRRHNRLRSAAFFSAVLVGTSIRAAAGRPAARASFEALVKRSSRVENRARIVRGLRELAV